MHDYQREDDTVVTISPQHRPDTGPAVCLLEHREALLSLVTTAHREQAVACEFVHRVAVAMHKVLHRNEIRLCQSARLSQVTGGKHETSDT